MIRVMHEEHEFSDLFLKFLLARSMRTQADLVDQLFNSSEKRLARILLLMAEFGKPGEPEQYIPEITQEDPDAAPDLLKSLDLGTVIEFDFAEGDERTQTGSHYTPDDLVQPLIKHSLDCPGAVVM
jgi:hypothetical protein